MTSFFFAATATSATRTENRTKSAEIYLTTVLAIFSNQAAITSSSRKRENEKKFCRRRRRRRRRCRCYCDKPASKSITTASKEVSARQISRTISLLKVSSNYRQLTFSEKRIFKMCFFPPSIQKPTFPARTPRKD